MSDGLLSSRDRFHFITDWPPVYTRMLPIFVFDFHFQSLKEGDPSTKVVFQGAFKRSLKIPALCAFK